METTTKTETQPAGGKPVRRETSIKTLPRRYKLKKAGVSRENYSVVLRFGLDSIRILLDAGMDATAVATKIGCTRGTLYSALKRHWGLCPQRVSILTPVSPAITWPDATPFTDSLTLGQVRHLLARQVRMADLVAATGLPPAALYRHASNLGYKFGEKTILVPAATTKNTATTTATKEDK